MSDLPQGWGLPAPAPDYVGRMTCRVNDHMLIMSVSTYLADITRPKWEHRVAEFGWCYREINDTYFQRTYHEYVVFSSRGVTR